MREIEFRGIQEDSKEWLYGDLLHYNEQTIISSHSYENIEDNYDENVIPETVGQYTGLKDKNGKKIFKGDIVKIKDATSETKYSNNEIFFDWRGAGIIKNNMHIRLDMLSSVEIIGDIHQDKHLIK